MLNNEDVKTVKIVGQALDYPPIKGMIDDCHRLRNKPRSVNPPGIVVKMVRRLNVDDMKGNRVVRTLV